MNTSTAPQPATMPADASAQRIVKHFQAAGFPGITEALVVRIRLKKGDQAAIEAAFDRALDQGLQPPLSEYFEIRPYGFYSEIRNFEAARPAIPGDFGLSLRREVPSIFFDEAPVVIDDALASGTKYDALVKFSPNALGCAVAVLLNDPNSSFFEYLDSHRSNDWQKIIGSFESAASNYSQDIDLI